MTSYTEANQTATEESAGDRATWSLTPFLTLVCRSSGFAGQAVRTAVRTDVLIGRKRPGADGDLFKEGTAVRWEVDDNQASRDHARLFLDGKTWRLTDLESKNGTYVNGERIRSAGLRDGDWIRVGSAFFLFRIHRASAESTRIIARAELSDEADAFVTLSPPLAEQFTQLCELAPTRLPLLIRGETGAGKELVAGEVHRRSERCGKFVAVNCGAIPETLIESELFGHKKGAFSGANDDRLGLVRAADRGTLFLDEIGELSEGSQVALLRVLQEREVRPVGSTTPVKVDVRIVAATHQDLLRAVKLGRFRDDLYARLAGHVVDLPPLRHRREDLGIIMSSLFRRHASGGGGSSGDKATATFSNGAMRRLLQFDFPHNIRELEHVLTKALALAGNGEKIRGHHLPGEDQCDELGAAVSVEDAALAQRLRLVLEENRGNIAATGRTFGKAPMQIRRWCERFNIDYRMYR